MTDILILNGPNLNLLGSREPGHYGTDTLGDIDRRLTEAAREAGVTIESRQSNHEGELVDLIQQAPAAGVRYMIVNPAAYSHTSIAMRDALAAVGIPFIEVHLSNIHAREPFRRHSYFSAIAEGVICGLGAQGYLLALDAAVARLQREHRRTHGHTQGKETH